MFHLKQIANPSIMILMTAQGQTTIYIIFTLWAFKNDQSILQACIVGRSLGTWKKPIVR